MGKYDVVRLLVANRAAVTARDNDGSVEYLRRRCTFGLVLGHSRRRVRSGPFIHAG
jgi:hypothetical protein